MRRCSILGGTSDTPEGQSEWGLIPRNRFGSRPSDLTYVPARPDGNLLGIAVPPFALFTVRLPMPDAPCTGLLPNHHCNGRSRSVEIGTPMPPVPRGDPRRNADGCVSILLGMSALP